MTSRTTAIARRRPCRLRPEGTRRLYTVDAARFGTSTFYTGGPA